MGDFNDDINDMVSWLFEPVERKFAQGVVERAAIAKTLAVKMHEFANSEDVATCERSSSSCPELGEFARGVKRSAEFAEEEAAFMVEVARKNAKRSAEMDEKLAELTRFLVEQNVQLSQEVQQKMLDYNKTVDNLKKTVEE